MGRRSEQRIAISFPVVVRGLDVRGAKFTFITKTLDISFSGASLKGLTDVVALGSKIEIECHTEKAQYRVVWVGQAGRANGDRIGVRCLEMGKYIWGVPPKEWEPDTYDPASPSHPPPVQAAPVSSYGASASTYAQPSWSGKERRQFARHPCRIEALVTVENESVEMPGKITDISLGGCYVEMLSPLPDGTLIRITLSPGAGTLKLSGRVCSSQTGFGMGVAFTGISPQDFERLRTLAPPTADAKPPVKAPDASPTPQRAPAPARVSARSYAGGDDELDLSQTAEVLEALIQLLLRKEIFTRGELAEELEKFKIIQR
jgi:PilZ domain